MRVSLKRLDPGLPVPGTAHTGDAGVDLHAAVDLTLEPGAREVVPTGVAVAIPAGHAGLVVPRSGMAARHGVGVVNSPGLVDAGYRGELRVILINHGSETVVVSRGDRIAQLVVVAVAPVEFEVVDELSETDRGTGGFGSTGS